MTYNAASRKDIRRAEKDAKAAEQTRRDVISALMQHGGGRAFMHELLVAAHIFDSSYSNDALTMAFREGERNQGLRLYAIVMAYCPDQFIQMMREANEREHTNERRSERDRDDDSNYDADGNWIGSGDPPEGRAEGQESS